MAQKRMFSKTITNSDAFLDLPDSSQVLYFHLNMNADDDGFIDNWKSIMRMTGTKEDDLKILIAKSFVIPFDSGVIVIKHWRINNYLQNDRVTPTVHQDEFNNLIIDNGVYCLSKDDFNNITLPEENISTKEKRVIAYNESDLPYSFDYKIRQAFRNEICPICGFEMKDYVNSPHRPTIQHNIPISKGGKHELGNISVICHKCNVSIQNKETGTLNSSQVTKKWLEMQECIQGCIHSIDKNSIDKNSIEYNICSNENLFEAFWKAYPKKKNKGNAEKWFKAHKPSKELVNTMLEKLKQQKDSNDWKKNDGQFIPYPATWLNAKAWEDEYEEKIQSGSSSWLDTNVSKKPINKEEKEELEDFLKSF